MVMPTKVYGDVGQDMGFLMSEAPGRISREQGVLAAQATRTLGGTVLGLVTATGKYVPLAPAANDGSQNAAAILGIQRKASTGDLRCALVARQCEVAAALLIWPSGITDVQKKAAEAQLALKTILVRH